MMTVAPKLPALSPDPVPTEADLVAIMRSDSQMSAGDETAKIFAQMIWRNNLKKADPDAFLVPLATEIDDFIGHLSYRSYLRSKLWKNIKSRALARSDQLCECCGEPAGGAHHRDYRPRVLKGQDILPLVAICTRCHNHVHEDPATREKRKTYEKQEAALAEIYGHGLPLGLREGKN